MQGRRLPDRAFTRRISRAEEPYIEPGDYGRVWRKIPDGEASWVWMCCTPNGLIGDLSGHDVTEHEDGTITVDPSILSSGGKSIFVEGDDREQFETGGLIGSWHGYLRQGVWSAC